MNDTSIEGEIKGTYAIEEPFHTININLFVSYFRVLNVIWCSCINELSSSVTILGFSMLHCVHASIKR